MAAITPRGELRDDAAAQFNSLQSEAKAKFGIHIPVTSAKRTETQQWELYNGWVKRLPGFSPAYPGNSPLALHVVHGGIAVDVGGRFAITGTAEHDWLKQAAPRRGFAVNAVNGEPWHIQYTLTPQIAATKATPISAQRKDTDMHMARHPNGAITLIGENTYQHLSAHQYANNVKAFGEYIQYTAEGYQQQLNDVEFRAQQTIARIRGISGSTVDANAIAAKIKTLTDTDFKRLFAQIEAINTEIGAPTAQEIALAVNDDAAARMRG